MTTQSTLIATAAPRKRGASGGWAGYLVRRAGGLLTSIGVLVVATFLIIPLLPGDPATAILGPKANLEAIEALRERLHLDEPLYVRFADYVAGIVQLDFGTSFRFNIPVAQILATKLPYTLSLAVGAVLIVLIVAIPLGMIVGVATRGDRRAPLALAFGAVAGFLASIPAYVTGTILVIVFAIGLRLLPPGGAASPASAILPIVALALGPTFALARVVRQETQTVIRQDFMRTARGHHLGAVRLYIAHALPNLLASTLTLAGIILAAIVGGTIIIENVFNYPGLGSEIVQSIIYKDYPVVQGIVLVVGLIAIVINLAIDILLGVVDPRRLNEVQHG